MNSDLEPLAVALKFGFLAVLFLFLLWVTRSALKDLRGTGHARLRDRLPRGRRRGRAGGRPTRSWSSRQGGGLTKGEHFDLFGGISLGRSADADIRLDDRYASGIHARVFNRPGRYFVEDMNSTNGTCSTGGELHGEAELCARRRDPDRRH